jgi:PAS domain S-box-containing protein
MTQLGKSPTTFNGTTRRLYLFLGIFGLALTALIGTSLLAIERLESQTHALSVVGAQRMLTQLMDRLAAEGLERALSAADRATLRGALEQYTSTAEALLAGGTIAGPEGQAVEVEALPEAALAARMIEDARQRRDELGMLLRPQATDAERRQAATWAREHSEPSRALAVEVAAYAQAAHRESMRRFRSWQLGSLSLLGGALVGVVATGLAALRRFDSLQTQARESAERDAQSHRLLTEVAARTSDLVVITDEQRQIVWVNQSFERVTGWGLDEVRGRKPGELLQGALTDASTVSTMRQHLNRGEGFSGVEILNYSRSGEPYWLDIEVQPLRDGQGRLVNFIATERVVTERRRAQAELLAARRAAEDASLEKSRFLARMGHELRTPLNAVLGLAQVLHAQARGLTKPESDHLRTIVEAGRHMRALVDDSIDLSRVESGDLSVSVESLNLNSIVEGGLAAIQPEADQGGVTLENQLGATALWVAGDHLRITQILLNLLSNAVKYNRPRGRVIVTGEVQGEECVVTVADEGAGLAPEQVARLFKPYERLGAEASVVQGTGIGLVISQRLAQLMKGRIEVHSSVGEGCRFSLRLPSERQCPLELSADSGFDALMDTTAATSPTTGRVLYVEDDPVSVVVFEACAAMRPGVQVSVARSAAQAFEIIRQEPPELIVLDRNLPDADGLELGARLLAKLPDTSSLARPTCLALLSADVGPAVRRRAQESGFAAVLSKPVELREVLGALDRLLTKA